MKAVACLALAMLMVAMGQTAPRAATPCRVLEYAFEPDCLLRGRDGRCVFDGNQPDLGPQIAVWIETANGTFVDTLFVTNAVGLYGIGNRPGRSDLRSGPRFPYGRRPMALPVWAHRRGKTYPAVEAKDGREDTLTYHERVSSPEPHFCRPMMPSEVVDAITCASGTFRDDKGILDPAGGTSPYPPRGDLLDWASTCLPVIGNTGDACDPGDAAQFEAINDLDAIAGATPPYDATYLARWKLPDDFASGAYVLFVEVGKELDQDAGFAMPSFLSPDDAHLFSAYGWAGNLGQPSVVYGVPFTVTEGDLRDVGAEIAYGTGDPVGLSGLVTPPPSSSDATLGDVAISPGSGWGRLRLLDRGDGPRHVSLSSLACEPLDCTQAGPPDAPRITDAKTAATSTSVTFTFRQASDHGAQVLAYENRIALVEGLWFNTMSYAHWPTAPNPPLAAPDTDTDVEIQGLNPLSNYAVSIRALGRCGWSAPSFFRAKTTKQVYRQLSGCVIATAAYGSPLAAEVTRMRRWRDEGVARSGWVALAAALYGQSAPPLAHALATTETGRAWVRTGLGLFMRLAEGVATPKD